MRTILFFIITVVLIQQQATAQILKITGPLGVYHTSPGYTYNDTTGNDSTLVQYQFRFGEPAIPNQAADIGFLFQPDIDSCIVWRVNKVIGIIQPPTEQGVNNQPADTSLYFPFPQPNGPGMIQGGHRFSQLSQLYGPFCGAILDDWNADTAITHQVHDALLGKYVDASGKVFSNSVATTPQNKLYCVIYNTAAHPEALPFIDGVSYWYSTGQNCCYYNLDNDISVLRTNYPHKEVMIGIYINGYGGWMDPVGIRYMLSHSLDSYDAGDINGITLFAGTQLVKDYMPLSIWKSMALPAMLDSLYYPYLGEGQGTLIDCNTNTPLTDAFVSVYCKGRVSGDTLMRSRQKTDASGYYQFGLWAGNGSTDSTSYWLVAEKAGYTNNGIGFWIKRNQTTTIQAVSLCTTGIEELNNAKGNMHVFPDPGAGHFTVEVDGANTARGQLEVYNLLGKRVYAATQPLAHCIIDLSMEPDGIYFIRATGARGIELEHILVLQH